MEKNFSMLTEFFERAFKIKKNAEKIAKREGLKFSYTLSESDHEKGYISLTFYRISADDKYIPAGDYELIYYFEGNIERITPYGDKEFESELFNN